MTQPRRLSLPLNHLVLAMALAACSSVPMAAMADQTVGKRHHYNIAPGPLGSVLLSISRQSGQLIAFDATTVQGRLAPAISGDLDVDQALGRALQGSGLVAEHDANGTVSLVPAKTAAATPEKALQTVTVTARRREENAQDVPTAITSLSGNALEAQRIYRIQDIQQLVPSTTVAYVHPRQSSIAVRGLGNNAASDGLEGSVGVYLDNVYLSRPGMAAFDLLDIDQIDVLRGPQGTLFGKNTTAGVVNVTTRPPTFTPERTVEMSTGSRGYVQTRGTLSGPITDTLAGRLSATRTHDDGFIKNEYNGHELNGGTRDGLRGQLLYKPDDDFSLRLIASYNDEDSSAGTFPLYSTGPTINGVNRYAQRAAAAGATLVYGDKVNIDSGQSIKVHQSGLSAEANWRMANDFTLTSITSYRTWNFKPSNDDGLDVPAYYGTGVDVHDREWSQEFRLASPKGTYFDYVLGAYYFGQSLNNESFTRYGPKADIWTGTPTGALNNVNSYGYGHIDVDSYALFAQGTWHLTPKLDLTAGVRATYEEKSGWVNREAPEGGAAVTGAAATSRQAQIGAYDSGNVGLHATSPSGLLSLAYHVDDNLMGYASLSHGEKSGGINMTVASAPTAGADSLLVGTERANAAELGLKSSWWDHRVTFNTDVFWTQVDGYQTNAYDVASTSFYLTNAGSVRSRGVEFDTSILPIDNLTININGSYNQVTYLDYKDAPCPTEISFQPGAPKTCDLTGHTVANAPRWIANVNGEYHWNLDNSLTPYVTGSYAYRSGAPGTVDDSSYAQIPAYYLVNLSTGLRGNFHAGQWDLSLWAKNAFNRRYYTGLSNKNNGGFVSFLGDPRTLGVTARYDF
ncbi:TonB-dependent receptor [Pseudomonas silvicola]|nr:TonB-dependent receptor [Pseudomonas silvicola]